jgi:hypothetical protein
MRAHPDFSPCRPPFACPSGALASCACVQLAGTPVSPGRLPAVLRAVLRFLAETLTGLGALYAPPVQAHRQPHPH